MKELNEMKLGKESTNDDQTGYVMTDYYGNKIISRLVTPEDYAYKYTSEINESVYSHFDSEYRVYYSDYHQRYDSYLAVDLYLPAREEKREDLNDDYISMIWNSLKTYRSILLWYRYSTGTSIPRVLKSFIGLSKSKHSQLLAILKYKNASLDKEVIVVPDRGYVYSYDNNYKLIGHILTGSTYVYDDYPYYD